jgi:hypothetical protein
VTQEELDAVLRRNPQISTADDHHRRPLQDAQPQLDTPAALVGVEERERPSIHRIAVLFTGYRVKTLDPDNFAGSVKDLLDGLRHSGLIPEDTAAAITLETEQIKVDGYKQEKTQITISYPNLTTKNNTENQKELWLNQS